MIIGAQRDQDLSTWLISTLVKTRVYSDFNFFPCAFYRLKHMKPHKPLAKAEGQISMPVGMMTFYSSSALYWRTPTYYYCATVGQADTHLHYFTVDSWIWEQRQGFPKAQCGKKLHGKGEHPSDLFNPWKVLLSLPWANLFLLAFTAVPLLANSVTDMRNYKAPMRWTGCSLFYSVLLFKIQLQQDPMSDSICDSIWII